MMTDPGLRCGNAGLDDPERRIDVGLHGRIEILARDIEDGWTRLLSGRVADHDVEPTEPFDGLAHQLLAECLVAEIARQREPLALLGLNQVDDLPSVRLFARKVIDCHVGPFSRECDRRSSPHPGVTAGDERLAAEKPPRTAIGMFAVIRRRVHPARQAGPWLRLLFEWWFRVFAGRIGQRRGRGGITPRCGRRHH